MGGHAAEDEVEQVGALARLQVRTVDGNLFAERIMIVAHTAGKQQRDVLSFLTERRRARNDGTAPPSLFDAPAARAAAA